MFYFLVGLVPCYPVCHLLATFFVERSFPSTPPPVPPLLRMPSVWFSPTPPLAASSTPPPHSDHTTTTTDDIEYLVYISPIEYIPPPPLIPLDTTHGGCTARPTLLSLNLVPAHPKLFARSKVSLLYDFPAILAAVGHSVGSTPNTKRGQVA